MAVAAAAAAAAGADDGGNGGGIAVVAPTVSAFGSAYCVRVRLPVAFWDGCSWPPQSSRSDSPRKHHSSTHVCCNRWSLFSKQRADRQVK